MVSGLPMRLRLWNSITVLSSAPRSCSARCRRISWKRRRASAGPFSDPLTLDVANRTGPHLVGSLLGNYPRLKGRLQILLGIRNRSEDRVGVFQNPGGCQAPVEGPFAATRVSESVVPSIARIGVANGSEVGHHQLVGSTKWVPMSDLFRDRRDYR